MTNEAMTNEPVQSKINWYRSPMDRATLAELNLRSDLLGFLQTLGHLGLLALTGAAAWYAVQAGAWLALIPDLLSAWDILCLSPQRLP